MALALLLGLTLPLTPAQILWINMALTITLGLVLAFEPPEDGVMRRPPRPPPRPLRPPDERAAQALPDNAATGAAWPRAAKISRFP